jgi:hypothetical protein
LGYYYELFLETYYSQVVIYFLNKLERIIRVYRKGTSIARLRSYPKKEAKEVG